MLRLTIVIISVDIGESTVLYSDLRLFNRNFPINLKSSEISIGEYVAETTVWNLHLGTKLYKYAQTASVSNRITKVTILKVNVFALQLADAILLKKDF